MEKAVAASTFAFQLFELIDGQMVQFDPENIKDLFLTWLIKSIAVEEKDFTCYSTNTKDHRDTLKLFYGTCFEHYIYGTKEEWNKLHIEGVSYDEICFSKMIINNA